VRSAHDCSDGGLYVALAECCILGEVGATITASSLDYFDESPSRIVVTVAREEFSGLASDIPVTELGVVGGSALVVPGVDSLPVTDLYRAWSSGLERALELTPEEKP
jgi:phosphoribosylformylglycinamidine synthase